MTVVVIFALSILAGALVGREHYRERKAMQDWRINDALNDGLQPIDPQWKIYGPDDGAGWKL